MNAKLSFKNTFKLNNSDRAVFVPFTYGLTARIVQMPLQEMVSDASYYSHSLEETGNLLKLDGIVTAYDSTMEAEILGCDVGWPDDYSAPAIDAYPDYELPEVNPEDNYRFSILTETIKRVVISKGRDVAVIGVLTGPCSLAGMLAANPLKETDREKEIATAGSLLSKLVKILCELRIDAVFFREDIIGSGFTEELQAHTKAYTDIYKTLFNLVKFYNVAHAVIVKDTGRELIPDIHRMLGMNGLILQGTKVNEQDLENLQELAESLKISFGLPLPMGNRDELKEQFAVIDRFLRDHKPTGFFYVSDGEVPHDMPLEVLHDLIAEMQNA